MCTWEEMWERIVLQRKYNKEAFCWSMPALVIHYLWMGSILLMLLPSHFWHGNSFKEISNSCRKVGLPYIQNTSGIFGRDFKNCFKSSVWAKFQALTKPTAALWKVSFQKNLCPSSGLGTRSLAGSLPGRRGEGPGSAAAGSSSTGGANAAPRFHTHHAAARLAPRGSQQIEGWLLDPPAFRR